MDSAVKMMEVDESPRKSNQPMTSNGEVNGSCDDASLDACSSPEVSRQSQPRDSANSNDSSSRFTEIQQKVPTSEVPADEPMTVDSDEDEDDDDIEDDAKSQSINQSTGDVDHSENGLQISANGGESEENDDLANGTEDDDEDEAISIDSESTDPGQIESVNIGDTDNSSDESDDHSDAIELHSDAIELHSDGPTHVSDDESTTDRNSSAASHVTNKLANVHSVKPSLKDSGDTITLVENDSEHNKSNGDVCSSPDIQEICDLSKDKDSSSDVVNLETPTKKKRRSSDGFTPRRSSRNLNKQRSYAERDEEIDAANAAAQGTTAGAPTATAASSVSGADDEEDPDIEEITPEDPLGLSDPVHSNKENKKGRPLGSTSSTIVVKDTKRLVEIAATSKSSLPSSGKKEPTLVIIDTNSILSGRGAVPVAHKPSLSTSYSVLPMALPAQGVYPANMRATITPIPMQPKPAPPPPQILPSLTDDMYVVEAPSFIVPYVYEKPPIKPLKEFVIKVGKELELQKKEQLLQEKLAKEKLEKEKLEREKLEKEKVDKEKLEKATSSTEQNEDDKDEQSSKDSNSVSKSEINQENGTSNEQNLADKLKDNQIDITKVDLDEVLGVRADISKPLISQLPQEIKTNTYFDNPLGKFFFNIGFNLVQEFVQTDLLKQQKRKRDREGHAPATNMAIASLIKNLEFSKENNEPFHMEMKKCDYCSFRSESALALAHHLETPHMRNYVYRCNFCPLEVRSPHDILLHMEAEHNTRGRLERAPAFHQCPNCPFEDNQKGKLSRHLIACAKKYKPEKNLEPPTDWEPPAKIPRLSRGKQVALVPGAAPYPTFTKNMPLTPARMTSPSIMMRQRGRPAMLGKAQLRSPMVYRPTSSGLLVPTSYQYGGNQIFTVVSGNGLGLEAESLQQLTAGASMQPLSVSAQGGNNFTIQAAASTSSPSVPASRSITNKLVHQPSISITPLPRQSSSSSSSAASVHPTMPSVKPGDPAAGKATFVICEICDGYIKDLEQLRNHMQWIHKVKIHPKMIYNRPPLNCQKCQFRFFTDQGLERHLLGSHGLVTSSMQEAANKGKDAGRCPVCGRVYQWKLLNHVARDHKITLKPAHLSYKCTVCTATFGMYKQFENHVYSAHSVVAKRVIEKKNNVSATRNSSDSLLKPLKINDEITIIPQPAKPKPGPSSRIEKVVE